jgi:hypothetical protein
MSKKSQVWTLDMIAGVTLFLLAIVTYFMFVNNLIGEEKPDFQTMYDDAVAISDNLLLENSDINSSQDSLKDIKITDGAYRLNASRLHNLSDLDYQTLKLKFNTRYNYLLYFENRTGEVMNISGSSYIGYNDTTRENIKTKQADDIVSIKRFLIYNSEIITMVVFLWL